MTVDEDDGAVQQLHCPPPAADGMKAAAGAGADAVVVADGDDDAAVARPGCAGNDCYVCQTMRA